MWEGILGSYFPWRTSAIATETATQDAKQRGSACVTYKYTKNFLLNSQEILTNAKFFVFSITLLISLYSNIPVAEVLITAPI